MKSNAVGAEEPGRVSAPTTARRTATWWIATLFSIGSVCFALPSIPALAALVPPSVCAATYFVSSLFFTSAALLVTVTTWSAASAAGSPGVVRSVDWWAAIIQLAGTLWFNLDTFHALQLGLSAHQENLRVWTPDFLGSICFLVSSELSLLAVCRRPWCVCRGNRDWTIAALNLAGSVFFMLSALAAFTRPATDDLLDASLANSGTLLGAICFLVGARLLLPSRPA
jgi:hypothetical protein